MGVKKFIHIDMDCFFAAIEMRENPALRGLPVVVGGSAAQRGVVSTANYVARQFGIHSAMPTATALRRCPHLIVLPVRMALYARICAQIRAILARYSAHIEPVSLDEAYLDVTANTRFQGSAFLLAQDMRRAIYAETGLTASAGVSSVKFLAKIASDMHKPDGIFCIPPQRVQAFLHALPLRKIPWVGPKTEKRLHQMGLTTCGDVQASNIHTLIKAFGKFGLLLWQRCHGVDDSAVQTGTVRKTVGVEKTLASDIRHWAQCERTIAALYPELLARLRTHHGSGADSGIKKLGVKLKFDDFCLTTHERACPAPDVAQLVQCARFIWSQRRAGRGVRLVGIHAALPGPGDGAQLALPWGSAELPS